MPKVVPWHHFKAVRAELAAAGHRLLKLDDPCTSACLATVAADRAPREFPVFPVLAVGELWLFGVDLSPGYRDFQTNLQIALQTLPTAEVGEEFQLRGVAEEIHDAGKKSAVIAGTEGRQGGHAFETLFRVRIQSAMHTRWENWGSAQTWPNYSMWRS